MIAQALQLNKSVLCLQRQTQYGSRSKLSAMINGHPLIVKSDYLDQMTYQIAVKRFLTDLYQKSLLPHIEMKSNAKKIFLLGPPGSGKSTAGQKLADYLGCVFISSGDICRQVVRDLSHPLGEAVRSHMDAGILVPPNIMKQLIVSRLKQVDCQMLGYILDGYPSQDDLDTLVEAQIEPDLVFLFKCDDETAIARQCSRGQRVTDEFNAARQRVETFHQNAPNFSYLTQTPVIEVDANQDADQVSQYLKLSVVNWINQPQHSYFPIPPRLNQIVNSTQFHFHIDADDQDQLIQLAKFVYAADPNTIGQIKVYPIQSLHLCQQSQELSAYKKMANFHEIKNSETEAFITGRMGDHYHHEMMSTIMKSCQQSGLPCSVELEQYLGEWSLTPDGNLQGESHEEQAVTMPEGFSQSQVADVPSYELHHGFNLSKMTFPTQPIQLESLSQHCKDKGFSNGGWFIFTNKDYWSYRSNEFSNLSSIEAQKRVFQQGRDLQEILFNYGYDDVDVMFSLEAVHGIYRFNHNKYV